MTSPILSIGIPTYNRAAELKHLLDSILPQLDSRAEILVCDNASTDGTSSIMSRYTAANASIRYLRHETNVGIDRNVDSLVQNAFGKYVWLCGDDDELEPGAVSQILSVLTQGDFAGGWVNYSSWDTEIQKCDRSRTAEVDSNLIDISMGELLSKAHFFFSFLSTHIVRREMWLAADERKASFHSPFTDSIWMLGHLLSGTAGRQFLIADPILRQRASIYVPAQVAVRPIALNWCRIMLRAVALGVPEDDVKPFFRVMVNHGHLTRSVLFKKRFAPEAARREFLETVQIFWKYPAFWIFVFPLFALPAPAVRLIQAAYRALRRTQGITYKEGM